MKKLPIFILLIFVLFSQAAHAADGDIIEAVEESGKVSIKIEQKNTEQDKLYVILKNGSFSDKAIYQCTSNEVKSSILSTEKNDEGEEIMEITAEEDGVPCTLSIELDEYDENNTTVAVVVNFADPVTEEVKVSSILKEAPKFDTSDYILGAALILLLPLAIFLTVKVTKGK